MNRQFGWLGGRREAIALGVAGVISTLGWFGTTQGWPLFILAHQPGFELALFLNPAWQKGAMGFLTRNEAVVFMLNLVVWTAVLLLATRVGRAISKAWKRSTLAWALLVALVVSALAELASYDNYSVPVLPTLARPGWAIASVVAPIKTFVIDSRTPLGLFSHPDRLITTALALVFNIAFWTMVLYLAALTIGWFQSRRSSQAAA